MPRQRMEPGEHGKITTKACGGGLVEARTYVRDEDGRRRQVRRTGRSAEAAERALKKHLKVRTTPVEGQLVTEATTLSELFDVWITVKVSEGELKPQSVTTYRQAWSAYGENQLGALRIRELQTAKADRYLKGMTSRSGAVTLRKVLKGMFGLAVRYGVVKINPIDGARTSTVKKKPPLPLVTPEVYTEVVTAIKAYTAETRPGPPRGRYLLPFVELLVATGGRTNEVLAALWEDIDLLAAVPTLAITGTLLDYGAVKGQSPQRQESRKSDGADLTVLLPSAAVEALTELFGVTGPTGLVFKNRAGGPMSAHNMRRALRAALPEHLKWVQPKSFRKATGTVVRDELGIEAAQQQLGHARLSTTENNYVKPKTVGPDARKALEQFMGSRGK